VCFHLFSVLSRADLPKAFPFSVSQVAYLELEDLKLLNFPASSYIQGFLGLCLNPVSMALVSP
jgi:hypothetical protein